MPVRGLWMPLRAEFRTWGALPGIEIIDAMITHLDPRYYVGWLTAASLHGVAHQAPQAFRVAVDRQVRNRMVGRVRFEFSQREIDDADVVAHGTPSGSALVSTGAKTMLDLATDVVRGGGIGIVATVLIELAELEPFPVADVARLASRYPAAATRNVRHVLHHFAGWEDLGAMRDLVSDVVASPSRLDPSGNPIGTVDREWMLYLNRDVEPHV